MLREPGFQGVDALAKLSQFITHGAEIGLHGRRGLVPVLRRKGKRPDGIGGRRPRFHDVSKVADNRSD